MIQTDGPYKGMRKFYDYLIGHYYNMTINHWAQSGSYVTTGHLNGGLNLSFIDGVTRHYDTIPLNSDYITLAFGLNEGGQAYGNRESVDTTEIWGAYNLILNWIKTNIPYAKVGIIAMDGWMSKNLANELKSIADYWSIGYLNIYDNLQCYYIGRNDVDVRPDVKTRQNTWADYGNAHPSAKAQEARMNYIVNWLETL